MNNRIQKTAAPEKSSTEPALSKAEKVPCDRCGKPMFRMRAVYWCDYCGYKTDCCGS